MFKKTLLAATALTVAATSAPVYADDAIETVVVTAQKREQNVQDVPISMNVVSAAQLNAFNSASLSDLMANVPSLMIWRTQTNVGLYLRGFGTTAANPAADNAVSAYQDGIWQEKSRQLMIDFFDVERIEVMRGAQGALVGKNTEVGAINIITSDPTDTLQGGGTLNYNFQLTGVDGYGYISGPVTDTISARLAVKIVDKEGWIKNTANGKNEPDLKKYQGRLGIKFQPTASITDVFKIEYSAWNQLGNYQLAADPTLPVLESLEAACCTKTDSGPLGRHNFDKQHGWRLSNKLDYDIGGGYTLSSISGFNGFNSDSLGAGSAVDPSGFATQYIEKYNGGSTELRLASPTGEGYPVDFIAGAYLDYSRYKFNYAVDYASFASFLAGVPGSPGFGAQLPTDGGLTIFDTERTFSYSAYASATWHVLDELRLIGSARFTHSEKDASYLQVQRYGTRVRSTAGILPGDPRYDLPLYAGVISTRDGSNDADFFDPALTAQYDVTKRFMVYASWSKGSKGAAFDFTNRTIAISKFVFSPETSTNTEVGLKSTPFEWLTLNATAFVTKLKNMQVTGFDPEFNAMVTRNAGEAESKGVELQVDIYPIENLIISNSVNYLNSAYTDFPGGACIGATSPYYSGPGCTPATNNDKGVPLQFVPQWSGNTSITYTMPLENELKLDVTGSIDWRTKMWLAPTYALPYGLERGASKLNLRIGVGDRDDAWSIAVVARNLTNRLTTNSSATYWGLESGKPAEVEIFPEEPRNIALQASVKF